ncbi:MAG: hypothetical protein ACP5NI_00605 [Acetobacteraceae bacterium]
MQIPARSPLETPAWLGAFESLGDNCEFGLFLRQQGVEQMGFFRFGFASLPTLLAMLETGFAGVGAEGSAKIITNVVDEYMVRLQPSGFTYHTRRLAGSVDPARLAEQEALKVRFLARKLLEDLEEGEKIFVRKGHGAAKPAEVGALHCALRRHGPACLLVVVPADPAHPAGSVERLGPGLLRGRLTRYAPYNDPRHFREEEWLAVCAAALRLRDEEREKQRPPARAAGRSAPPVAPRANLLSGIVPVAAEPRGPGSARAFRPLALDPAEPVLRHRCSGAEPAALLTWPLGLLRPGEPLVAACAVWLPEERTARNIVLALPGLPRLRSEAIDRSLRGRWQPLSLTVRFAGATVSGELSLLAAGEPGAEFFTTCWRLTRGSYAASLPEVMPAAAPGLARGPDKPAR